MEVDRHRYGLLVSCLGAMLLAISVFLPWYALSFTAAGIAFTQQLSDHVVAQLGGSSAAQGYMSSLHNNLGALVGHKFAAVSAHQVLKQINVALLLIAGLGILLSLVPLVWSESFAVGAERRLIAGLGALASLLVLYRMVEVPSHGTPLIGFSLREGAWLALCSSLAMIVGAFLGSPAGLPRARATKLEDAWSGLSGWTPEA